MVAAGHVSARDTSMGIMTTAADEAMVVSRWTFAVATWFTCRLVTSTKH